MSAVKIEKTDRRDALIAIEKKYQKIWADEKVFEVDAPTIEENPNPDVEDIKKTDPSFYSTMAYPYMNGILHAGHSFTLSKVEFAVGFERMKGKRALFPLGFHCTGMPIKASADKIKREVEQFGADFSGFKPEEEEEEVPVAAKEKTDPTKFQAKKSKAVAKQGRSKYQFEIMLQLGIPKEEIAKFADSNHWLYFFPRLVQKHVTNFGGRVDWRRSNVTTDANLYYDAFVRWTITRLYDNGKVKFGERYTIYSEKDGQACLDHDRSSGEGIVPQEYTGIKIKITEFSEEATNFLQSANFSTEGKNVFLVAATLRPETMYGQTCCFVSPNIQYGIFHAGNDDYFITTERAFKNMSYQKLTPVRGDYTAAAKINGKLLVGSKIVAPLAEYKELRVLPMETVLEKKGTGVVTCVPSDSPDDYVTTRDLANKPEYYGINKDWVISDIVPIISTEKYGDKCAETLVQQMKIQSPKDSVQLAAAKEAAYKEGFYNGTMAIGKYKGEKVEVAKAKVKADLIESGDAFVYNEPEGVVVSRSGDECIVSLEDQWYIDYGEETWRNQALECLDQMNTFAVETRNGFEGVLDWLKNWALTRNFGLGTRLPWDEKYLIESLSDSTIFMAYYVIARFFHSDYYGLEKGVFDIKPEQLTYEVFDYIFTRTDTVDSTIPKEQLDAIRREFEYFYPIDFYISGKDLIPNHMTFLIYSHVALFPKRFWPKGIRVNGHLLLNNAKMSKSTGNFLTLEEITAKFGADASRIAMADAGDTIEDANFEESNANAAILRLTTLKEWCEEQVKNQDSLRSGDATNFFDVAFENEMNDLIVKTHEAYTLTNFKAALKTALFDFQAARDYYRDAVASNVGMHKDLVLKYIETQVLLIAPIAPHFAEYIYREVLGKNGSIQTAAFPKESRPVSQSQTDSLEYVRQLSRAIREAEFTVLKSKKGKNEVDASKPTKLTILLATSFPEWQDSYIELVRELFEKQSLDDNKAIKERVGKDMKRAMPFITLLKQRLAKEDPATIFDRKLTFNEVEVIKSVLPNLEKSSTTLTFQEVEVIAFENGAAEGENVLTGDKVPITVKGKVVEGAVPGEPGLLIRNLN